MPRTARKKSETGIYNIIIRGINRQNIFEDDEDRIRFLETLDRYKEETGCELYAYCLMSNHVHLLVKENDDGLSSFMKRVNGSYAYWYNWKYDHVGHLFQDRFKSEPVDDDTYFLTVIRYIHRNPLTAGMTDGLEYAWSSYTTLQETE
ncbi:MAG: transposase [Syntrophomonadaceae bacterium]|jgi:putative transposase